jgi:mannose-6-phosphate isomerase-like protein (cupin superfamily)
MPFSAARSHRGRSGGSCRESNVIGEMVTTRECIRSDRGHSHDRSRVALLGTLTRMTLDELDGVAADPDHHEVLFENDEVRVIRTTIRTGDVTPLHTHLTPTVLYVVSGSQFHRRAEDGSTLLDTKADPDFVLPKVSFSPPTPRHTLENTGEDDLVVIGVELKQPRAG